MSLLTKLFGMGESADLGQLVKDGALIIDVRSKGEYAGGHVKGSVNIPLDQLGSNLDKLKNKEQAIITCCASGMRSGSAKNFLKQQGYTNVHNGGPWTSVDKLAKN